MELKTADEALGKDLAEIYRREYRKLTDRDADLLYMPATDKAKWWCSCGVMNLISQMHCRVCGASIADLSRIMWKDYLQQIYDKEHPEEAAEKAAEKAAAEKAAAEEEARKAAEEEAARKAAEEEAARKAAEEEAARKAAEEEAARKAAEEEAARKAAEEEAARKAAEEEAARKAAEEEAARKAAEEEAARKAAEEEAARKAAEEEAARKAAEEEAARKAAEEEAARKAAEEEAARKAAEEAEAARKAEEEAEAARRAEEAARRAEKEAEAARRAEEEEAARKAEEEEAARKAEEEEAARKANEPIVDMPYKADEDANIPEENLSDKLIVPTREDDPEDWSLHAGDTAEHTESRLVGTWDAASYRSGDTSTVTHMDGYDEPDTYIAASTLDAVSPELVVIPDIRDIEKVRPTEPAPEAEPETEPTTEEPVEEELETEEVEATAEAEEEPTVEEPVAEEISEEIPELGPAVEAAEEEPEPVVEDVEEEPVVEEPEPIVETIEEEPVVEEPEPIVETIEEEPVVEIVEEEPTEEEPVVELVEEEEPEPLVEAIEEEPSEVEPLVEVEEEEPSPSDATLDITFESAVDETAASILEPAEDLPQFDMDDFASDLPPAEEPEEPSDAFVPPVDDGPRVHLEDALEMPGFGELQTMEAMPEEDSAVEFLDLPDEPVEKVEKKGRFGGLFGRKNKKKKGGLKPPPEDFSLLGPEERDGLTPRPIQKPIPEPVAEPEPEETPEEAEEIINLDEAPEEAEEIINPDETHAEEPEPESEEVINLDEGSEEAEEIVNLDEEPVEDEIPADEDTTEDEEDITLDKASDEDEEIISLDEEPAEDEAPIEEQTDESTPDIPLPADLLEKYQTAAAELEESEDEEEIIVDLPEGEDDETTVELSTETTDAADDEPVPWELDGEPEEFDHGEEVDPQDLVEDMYKTETVATATEGYEPVIDEEAAKVHAEVSEEESIGVVEAESEAFDDAKLETTAGIEAPDYEEEQENRIHFGADDEEEEQQSRIDFGTEDGEEEEQNRIEFGTEDDEEEEQNRIEFGTEDAEEEEQNRIDFGAQRDIEEEEQNLVDFGADEAVREPESGLSPEEEEKKDEEPLPEIVFPDDPGSGPRLGDVGDWDFPDATIPESPMPDPAEDPFKNTPPVEFPDGPQTEITMNPNPENKEKARPFRNPGAAEETSSGSVVPEQEEPEPAAAEDQAAKTEEEPETETSTQTEAEPQTEAQTDTVTPDAAAPAQTEPIPETKETKGLNVPHVALIVAIVVVAVAILVVGFFTINTIIGNSEAAGIIETANSSISKLAESDIPTQEDFNKALQDYNAVPYDRKGEVANADLLEKYKDVDLKTVRDVATRMAALDENSPFADVLALEQDYERLTVQERQFVDPGHIEGFKRMNEMEKTALQAVTNIRSLLPVSDNFRVTGVTVKDDTDMSISYRMRISYSYVDEQGTLREQTTYLSMMSPEDDVAYNEAVNTGHPESYTAGTTEMEAFNKCESPEVELDVDKIMYFLENPANGTP